MSFSYFLLSIFSYSASFMTTTAIVGGNVATDDQFPYQVSLLVYNDHGQGHGLHACGGGIIGDQFILAAAHCVVMEDGRFRELPMTARAGTTYLHGLNSRAITIEVQKVFVPKEYNATRDIIIGDIAVLKLKHVLGLLHKHTHLKKLELPKHKNENYANETAEIAGFGWNKITIDSNRWENGTNTDGRLRFAVANVLTISNCQKAHPNRSISDKEICAQIQDRKVGNRFLRRGVCNGDSGGPLVHNRTTVIGILSSSPKGCNERRVPAIYVLVSHYVDFIKDAMNEKKNDYTLTAELPLRSNP